MAITKKDVETLKETFATRDEMNQRFNSMQQSIDQRFNVVDQRLNEMTKTLDYAVKLLETRRDEDAIAAAKDREQDQRLDNLDSRVLVIERSRA